MGEAYTLLLLFTSLSVIISFFLLLETSSFSFLLLPIMIFVLGLSFIGINEAIVDEMSDYSKDDIFRVMISTDNRDPFFWEQVVRESGVDDVREVFTKFNVI